MKMQRYEIAILSTGVNAAAKLTPRIAAWTQAPGAGGRLLGILLPEFGTLNQVLVLRGFETPEAFAAERARTLADADPFGCAEALTGWTLDAYQPLPFVPPIAPGAHGRIYEVRTYALKPGGLRQMISAWEAALPARVAISPCLMAMHTIEGAPRFTHIWPYAGFEARAAARAEASGKGIWPPQGGTAPLLPAMSSTIWVPAPESPLR
ncbi:MAG: NIPSNAP family protein [Acetobacteraceae bacterium]